MAHGAGHSGLGKRDTEPLLGGARPMEEKITDLDLLHELFVERLELVWRVLLLVGQRPVRSRAGKHDQQAEEDTQRRQHVSSSLHRPPPSAGVSSAGHQLY